MLGGSATKSRLNDKLEKSFEKKYEKTSELNRMEREKIDSRKNWTLGFTAGGLAIVAVAASVVVTGPFGLLAAGAASLSGVAGGATGVGIGAAIKKWAPRGWFGKKEALKDQVKESKKDETDENTV